MSPGKNAETSPIIDARLFKDLFEMTLELLANVSDYNSDSDPDYSEGDYLSNSDDGLICGIFVDWT